MNHFVAQLSCSCAPKTGFRLNAQHSVTRCQHSPPILLIDMATRRLIHNETFIGVAAQSRILAFEQVVDVSLGEAVRTQRATSGRPGEYETVVGTPITLEGWDGTKYHNYNLGLYPDRDGAEQLAKDICCFIDIAFGALTPEQRARKIYLLAQAA